MVSVGQGVLKVKGLAGASETIQFLPAGSNGVQVLVDGINLGSYSGQVALEQAMTSWTSSAAYSARATRVSSELAALVRNHTGTDESTGGDGMDLLFANLSLPARNKVDDLQGNDTVVDLSGKTH
jgi:hypothetical protein